MPSSVTVRLPTSEDLEAYALEQWEVALLPCIFPDIFLDVDILFLILLSMIVFCGHYLVVQKDVHVY